METGGAPGRSRSSQSPSPSHSHSASSSAHNHQNSNSGNNPQKRKFSSTATAVAAAAAAATQMPLSSADELDSITREDDEDDDTEDDDPEVDVDEEEEDEDEEEDNSIRTFTSARLESSGTGAGGGGYGGGSSTGGGSSGTRSSSRPPRPESSGVIPKSEPSSSGGGGIDAIVPNANQGNTNSGGAGPGMKEDMKGFFTENLQTSGAYSAREEGLKREEDSGKLKFLCYSNDGVDEHMIWLIGLKNIFARQLPNMPRDYIVRLVMDRTHKSMMVIRHNVVVGGITYRPYLSQRFGEIAFCAITADEQVKGYGTRLMNHLKQHARDVDGITHFLTYADNNAVGYFLKQGFTKEITLDKERWQGYIKDYDGGLLMECVIDPKLPYTDLATMVRRQRQAIDEKIRELSNCHIVYEGIDFQKKEAGIPRKVIKVEEIRAFREAGWTPDQWGHSKFKSLISVDPSKYRQQLNSLMRQLWKSLNDHPDAWPFKEPVDGREVPDYYDIIKDPMDLKTMLKRLESEQYYVTLEMFVADVRRMFTNAHTYNAPETIYYKCATRLNNHFTIKLRQQFEPLPSNKN